MLAGRMRALEGGKGAAHLSWMENVYAVFLRIFLNKITFFCI